MPGRQYDYFSMHNELTSGRQILLLFDDILKINSFHVKQEHIIT